MYKRICCVAVLLVATALWGQQLLQRGAPYQLRAGDQISVEYTYTPEYNTTVSVQPDGEVSLPFAGTLKLGGLTIAQAHDLIYDAAKKWLNDPKLSVVLKDFEKPYYVVGGEVGSPGRYEIHGPITALRAVEIAGGIKASGKTTQILLIRPINGTDAKTQLIDLKKLLKQKNISSTEDVQLHDGDILIVPRTKLASVEPYIKLLNAGLYVSPYQ